MTEQSRLDGIVALVTGASRGIGKGVALELGSLGATVYVTGRTTRPETNRLGGRVGQTALEIDEGGGHGVAVRCDHAEDEQVERVFEQIRSEQGRLDILVNNACSAQDMEPHIGKLAWQQPLSAWGPDQAIDLVISESPRFTGRAVAALHADEKRLEKTGRAFACAELALHYGFTDVDGQQPPVIRSQEDVAEALPRLFNAQS